MDEAQIRVRARIARVTPAPAAVKQKECVWEMKLR
jgi:hypothetical protein